MGIGLYSGLVLAPPDYQQGDAYRIIYVHVPSAILSLFIYANTAFFGSVYLIWRLKIADVLMQVSAVIGAWFTFLALVTGALWGKPMWGAWWIWDARLTSELVLLFLYLGIIALRAALSDPVVASKACGILGIIGLVDLPLIHYSVNWWNTLHQKATLLSFAKPQMAPEMLYPLLCMIVGFFCYYGGMLFLRARKGILHKERAANWVRNQAQYRRINQASCDTTTHTTQ